jgi:hypothetical protein
MGFRKHRHSDFVLETGAGKLKEVDSRSQVFGTARLLLAFAIAGAGLASAQQSTQVLADILEGRGLIAHSERARIREASAEDAVRLIASILSEKGLIDAADVSRVSDPAAARAVEMIRTTAAVPVPAPKPAPQTTPEAPPMTAQSRFPIRVYGTLLFNSFFNTSLNNLEDIPLFAGKQGSDITGGDKNFGMTVRQSRVGMRYTGTRIGDAKLSGHVEFDFFGGQSALANGVGFDIFRLRLAYGRVDWRNFSLVAGQDWSVFAPLNPTSLATFAIPGMSSSGNLWIRSPQVRAEYRYSWSDNTHVQFQFAATDPDIGDSPTTFATVRTAGIGERGRLPGADSRVLFTERAVAVGLSGHYSRGKNAGTVGTFNVQNGVDSWGAAVDYTVPVGKYLILTGEAYQGRALGIFSSA